MKKIQALQDAKQASAVSLGGLVDPSEQEQETLLGDRYICRGGGWLMVGPTGVEKSSFALQAAACFALGKPCFGIAPAQPLRSLIIQAENDAGDMIEMRDGVFAGLGLNKHERECAGKMINCFQENTLSSQEFFARTVEPLLRQRKLDLLWTDPRMSRATRCHPQAWPARRNARCSRELP